MRDFDQLRDDFPILATKVWGKSLVYFDNGATTQKPRRVVEKITQGYYSANANIHRGVHFLSQAATAAHEKARETVAEFLNAGSSKEIVFTRGTTEAINLVASSFSDQFMKEGDEVILSEMEHHSNIVPWQLLREKKGIVIKVLPITDEGVLMVDQLDDLICEKTKLISITHVSNVLGTINPVKEIIQKAHAKDIPVLIDGAQAAPHLNVDVQDLDVDFYVFSAHKVYGPTGIGALYGKEKWLNLLPPYQGGGEMISSVSFEKTVFNELPFKFEAGTPDFIGSTAFAEALIYVSEIGLDRIAAYEDDLLLYATSRLQEIEGLKIYGTAPHKSGVISFLLEGIHPLDVGTLLDKLGIAVRTGQHCAEPLMKRLGIEGTIRVSFSFYNTKEEIDVLIVALQRIISMF